jgi:HlyD family secretion protein
VVFLALGKEAKMVSVEVGINDDNYIEVLKGVTEGQAVISGGYKAIARDLADGKRIKVAPLEHEP